MRLVAYQQVAAARGGQARRMQPERLVAAAAAAAAAAGAWQHVLEQDGKRKDNACSSCGSEADARLPPSSVTVSLNAID